MSQSTRNSTQFHASLDPAHTAGGASLGPAGGSGQLQGPAGGGGIPVGMGGTVGSGPSIDGGRIATGNSGGRGPTPALQTPPSHPTVTNPGASTPAVGSPYEPGATNPSTLVKINPITHDVDKYTPSDIAWLILALIIAVLSINLLRQVRIVQRSYGMLAQLNGDGDWVVVGLLTSAIWVFWISFWWSRRPEIGPETVKDFFHLIVMVPRDFIIPVILTSVTPLILVIVRSIIALSTPQDDSDYPSSRPSVVPHLVLSAIGLAADVLTLKAGVLS